MLTIRYPIPSPLYQRQQRRAREEACKGKQVLGNLSTNTTMEYAKGFLYPL